MAHSSRIGRPTGRMIEREVHRYTKGLDRQLMSRMTFLMNGCNPIVFGGRPEDHKSQIRAMLPQLLSEVLSATSPLAATDTIPVNEPAISEDEEKHAAAAHAEKPTAAQNAEAPHYTCVQESKPTLKRAERYSEYPAYKLGARNRNSEPEHALSVSKAKELVRMFYGMHVSMSEEAYVELASKMTPPEGVLFDEEEVELARAVSLPERSSDEFTPAEQLVEMIAQFHVSTSGKAYSGLQEVTAPSDTSTEESSPYEFTEAARKVDGSAPSTEATHNPSCESKEEKQADQEIVTLLPSAPASVDGNLSCAVEKEDAHTTKYEYSIEAAAEAAENSLVTQDPIITKDSLLTQEPLFTQDTAISKGEWAAIEPKAHAQDEEPPTEALVAVQNMSAHSHTKGTQDKTELSGNELIVSVTSEKLSTPSILSEPTMNDSVAPSLTPPAQNISCVRPDTTQESESLDEDSSMEGISVSVTTIPHLQDDTNCSERNGDQVEPPKSAIEQTDATAEPLSRVDSQQDSIEIEKTTMQHDEMEVDGIAKATEISNCPTTSTQYSLRSSDSASAAMVLTPSSTLAITSEADDEMADIADASPAQNMDIVPTTSQIAASSTSQDAFISEPRSSTFGRDPSFNVMPIISSAGIGRSFVHSIQSPSNRSVFNTLYSGVAAALVHDFPNLHMDLQDALLEIEKQRGLKGAQGISEKVCEGIRNATSAEGLAYDIQCEMQKAPGIGLLTDYQLTRLKMLAFKARHRQLPHQQQDSCMTDEAPETRNVSSDAPRVHLLPPSQPERPVPVDFVTVDMADAPNDNVTPQPITDTPISLSTERAGPETPSGTAPTEEVENQAMQGMSEGDQLLGLVSMGMGRFGKHMFSHLFQMDLDSKANCEAIVAHLLNRRWKASRGSTDPPFTLALRNLCTALNDPAPAAIEKILFDCQKFLARGRIACRNHRNSTRHVQERKDATGKLVTAIANQNYVLMTTMSVPYVLTWDEIVSKIDGIDKQAFANACAGSRTYENMYFYRETMKPFELYWFASTAVEDYILDQEEIRNPGSRPSRITPADRAQKHRVAVEDRDKRRPNQGDGGAGGVGRG